MFLSISGVLWMSEEGLVKLPCKKNILFYMKFDRIQNASPWGRKNGRPKGDALFQSGGSLPIHL